MNSEELIVTTKEQYLHRIAELLTECNDIPLLDLIFKLLNKSL